GADPGGAVPGRGRHQAPEAGQGERQESLHPGGGGRDFADGGGAERPDQQEHGGGLRVAADRPGAHPARGPADGGRPAGGGAAGGGGGGGAGGGSAGDGGRSAQHDDGDDAAGRGHQGAGAVQPGDVPLRGDPGGVDPTRSAAAGRTAVLPAAATLAQPVSDVEDPAVHLAQ